MTTTAEPRDYSPSDFLYGTIIGEGRFGSVVYAEHATQEVHDGGVGYKLPRPQDKQNDGQGYAVKMIPKSEILRHQLLQAVMTEKRILAEVLSSNQDNDTSSSSGSAALMIPKLFCCFHDDSYLYFVLELCSGGTMLDLVNHCAKIRRDNSCNDSIRQLVRVLEYIHQKGVIHRDISPRNILFTSRGALKLCDFGSAVVIGTSSKGQHLASSRIDNDDFVGTADYVCPEMIRGSIKSCCTGTTSSMSQQDELLGAIDLWSLGCLIFQMSVGESPFHAESDQGAFQRVLDYTNHKSRIHVPPYTDMDVKGLIFSLVAIDATSRIGLSDGVVSSKESKKPYHSLRRHKFFTTEDKLQQQFWTLLENNSIDPPYTPAEQSWMTQLHQSGWKMKRIEEMCYEL
ncbi:3-phosphoinositide-dependent protein kinase [Skeletonema marinoi]|uniref:non-specific serine/threonine protein kinase n=1 Tax=Skeletonema marinoi TaxID=267567 RepID=A0AAD8XXD0_9STRA|nr:3-phosphoinositide-dependent protein kinase [Skeletonema marinoi]